MTDVQNAVMALTGIHDAAMTLVALGPWWAVVGLAATLAVGGLRAFRV